MKPYQRGVKPKAIESMQKLRGYVVFTTVNLK